MTKTVIICGKLFDGLSDAMLGPTEILIEDDTIAEVSSSVGRPEGAQVLDLSDRTVSPGFIDTHVHLCVDGLNLARQTLQCSSAKALAGLHYAQQYMRYGFTTLRDMGTLDPEWPTINLRDAIDNGIARGPRADRCCPYDQRHRRPRRHARHVSLPMPYGTVQGCGLAGEDSRVGSHGARIRRQLDQDHEHGGLYERRRRSGQSNVVRR